MTQKRGQRRELNFYEDAVPEDMRTAIIGLDIAKPPYDKSDFSALSMVCGNCRLLVHTELFVGETPNKEIPKFCCQCGCVFKNNIIVK